MTTMKHGLTAASQIVGPEGFIGFVEDVTMPNITAVMQVAGTALSIDAAELLERMSTPGHLQSIMRRYIHARMAELAQVAACNGVHCIRERLACWLLLTADRVGTEFRLTHEAIAHMLGARRATVTIRAEDFHRMGLITYRHGKVHILDRQRLEKLACECYELRRHVFDNVFTI